MKLLLTLCLAGLLAACAQKSTQMSGAAESDAGYAAATLAPYNSFEYFEAPLYTRIAVEAHFSDRSLKSGAITKAEAQADHDRLAHVMKLLAQALSVCGEDPHSGQCMKDQSQAGALLAQAASELGMDH